LRKRSAKKILKQENYRTGDDAGLFPSVSNLSRVLDALDHNRRMRSARRLLFAVALVGILSWFAWFILKPREPSYQGRSLSNWLEEASEGGFGIYPDARPEAVNAIRQIGTNAIPTLLKMAKAKDSKLTFFLRKWNNRFPRLDLPFFPTEEMRGLAVTGFYVLGPKAKSAVPGLTGLLKSDDEDIRITAALCLGCLHEEAKPAVPELMKEFEREVSRTNQIFAAAFALGKIGPSASAAVPVLNAALTNRDPTCRIYAQATLINIHAAPISQIIEQLKDTQSAAWTSAVVVAWNCGTNAAPAIPLLIAALDSTNSGIQLRALLALYRLHLEPEKCVPALILFLESTNHSFRYENVAALRAFGKKAKPAVPALIRRLDDSEEMVRRETTNALRDIDPEAAVKFGIK
jgi:HEAT repeat protein